MSDDIKKAIWLDAKQVRTHYAITRSTLDRRVAEGKIIASKEDTPHKNGVKRYLHDSIIQYIASLGNGLDKVADPNYRYKSSKKYPFPTFTISKPDIYSPIDLD
jgi:hypothetical protein